MFCKRCGAEINDDAGVCGACGIEIAGKSNKENSTKLQQNLSNNPIQKSKPKRSKVVVLIILPILLIGILLGCWICANRPNVEKKEDSISSIPEKKDVEKVEASKAIDLVEKADDIKYQVTFYVYSAVDISKMEDGTWEAKALQEVKISFREGAEIYDGNIIYEMSKNTGEWMSTELVKGVYTAQIDVPGYASTYQTIDVTEEMSVASYMIPELQENELGFVLTWDGEADLDLALVLGVEENEICVGAGRLTDEEGNRLISDNSALCEVLYINAATQKDYKLCVNNYTDSIQGSFDTKRLAESNVRIYCYSNNGYEGIYSLESDEGGVMWEVAEIKQGKKNIINQLFNLVGEVWWTNEKYDEVMGVYKRFLDNEEVVYVDGFAYYISELEADYTKESIIDWGDESEMLDAIEYGFIDCGLDGRPELIIRFIGLNMYEENDDSGRDFVITYKEGKLISVYSMSYWARQEEQINYAGIVSGWGSGGASSGSSWLKYIDEEGVIQRVYNKEYSDLLPSYGYSSYLKGQKSEYKEIEKLSYLYEQEVNNFFSLNSPYYIYTIGDNEYYVSSADIEWEQFLVNNNFRAYTETEIDEIMMNYAIQLIGSEEKANEILLCNKEIEWQTWERPCVLEMIMPNFEGYYTDVQFWFSNEKKITKVIYDYVSASTRDMDFNGDGVNEAVLFTTDIGINDELLNIDIFDTSKGTVQELEWQMVAREYCNKTYNQENVIFKSDLTRFENGNFGLYVIAYNKVNAALSEVASFSMRYEGGEWKVNQAMSEMQGEDTNEETQPKPLLVKKIYLNSDGTPRTSIEYEYDLDSNILREMECTAGGLTFTDEYEFGYDSEGNIAKKSDLDKQKIEYGYDINGNMNSKKEYLVNSDGTQKLISECIYDAKGRLIKEIDHQNSGKFHTFEYNEEGQKIKEISWYQEDFMASWSVFNYNPLGRMVQRVNYSPEGKVNSEIQCAYDANGHLTTKLQFVNGGNLNWCYEAIYDDKGNLIEEKEDDGKGGFINWVKYEWMYFD